MKYAEDIIREINERGPINIPDNCCASDGFDKWMYYKEIKMKLDDMSFFCGGVTMLVIAIIILKLVGIQ